MSGPEGTSSAGRAGARLLQGLGVLLLIQLGLALSPLLSLMDRHLGAADWRLAETADYVVVLGGGGIPSESGLIRTYAAADYALEHPQARVVVSLPADEDPETSSVGRMRDELVMRGVAADRILMETQALNTHQQAAAIRRMLPPEAADRPVLIVTSDYHLRRALLCFQQEGFRRTGGLPAASIAAEADPGPGAWLRYTLWNRLARLPTLGREYLALAAYRLRGWI